MTTKKEAEGKPRDEDEKLSRLKTPASTPVATVVDEGKENVPEHKEKSTPIVTTPSPDKGKTAARLRVSRFYTPVGGSKLTAVELTAEVDKIGRVLLEGLVARQKEESSEKKEEVKKNEEVGDKSKVKDQANPTLESSVPFNHFDVVTKVSRHAVRSR